MKKLFSVMLALAIFSAIFISCSKDDENASPSNSITITGEFIIGEKTYTNPTFDLGEPELHEGYVRPNYQNLKVPVPNMIEIEPFDQFDLGNNTVLDYGYSIYSDAPGTDLPSSAHIEVYLNVAKESGIWLYCDNLLTTVTKVGDVGGYIEGTYEGTFYPSVKSEVSYPVKGKFKVKRIEYITK